MSPVRARSPTLKSHKDLGRFHSPLPAPKVLIVAVLYDRFLDAMCPFADGRPKERPAERWKRLGPKAKQEPPPRLKENPAVAGHVIRDVFTRARHGLRS